MKRFSVGLNNNANNDQLETLSSARSSIANTNTNQNPHYTLSTNNDLVSKAIQSHGIERKTYFRSTSLQMKSNTEEKPQAEPPSNFSITQIDNNLVRIPVKILEMKNILNILDLSRNKFEYFPLEIVQICGLRSLKMDYNKIKYLPAEISKLSNLEILSISNNYIPNIPPSLPQLSRLRSLDFECNRIDSFSHEVTGLRSLESLNIMRNRLANFPCSFKDLTKLTEFHFEWFRYTVPIGKPSLKTPEDENKLAKLREKCAELYKKNILTFSFIEFLAFFTQDKINIKAVDPLKGRSMLHQAVLHEDISVIRYIIPSAPELIDQIDRDKMTPLCLSLVKEKFRSSIYLLKHGANPTKSSHSIGSPIHIATKKLNFPIVREILRLGESLNKQDVEGNTCLHIAMGLMCDGEDPEKAKNIVEYLLEKGANPNIRNKEGWTPAHIVARKKNNECLKWALSYNFEINEILGVGEKFDFEMKGGVYSWTATHIAAYADSPDVLMSLGEAGVDMFKKSKNGFTPKRVINKAGLGLRLIQKYEKQQIKNVLFTKRQLVECISSRRKLISDPAFTGGVRIASKDILAKETSEILETENKKYGYKFSTKLKKNAAPFMNSERTPSKRRGDEKSPEPEEDISSDEESAHPSSIFDISVGLDEDVSIIVDPYTKESGFNMKNVLQKKERQSFHRRVLTTENGEKLLLQEQWQYNDEPELPDLTGYEEALRKEEFFGIDYCKDELKMLKESLISENLALSEKLKVFTALKILHKAIIEWIYKKYAVRVQRQDFCYFIFKENVQKANFGLSERSQGHLKEMISICELIPQCLVSVFMGLGTEKFENSLVKGKICEMLGDLQSFAAIEFLNNVMMNPLENAAVKKQAQRVKTMLMGQLQEGKNVRQQSTQGLLFGENQNNPKEMIGIKLNNVIANYEKTRLSAGLQSKMV